MPGIAAQSSQLVSRYRGISQRGNECDATTKQRPTAYLVAASRPLRYQERNAISRIGSFRLPQRARTANESVSKAFLSERSESRDEVEGFTLSHIEGLTLSHVEGLTLSHVEGLITIAR